MSGHPLGIEHVVTSGIFSLDGQDFEVDNNIWLVGDEHKVIVIDAAHDHRPIVEAIGDRQVIMIVATHGHNDHINAAAALADATHGPIAIHPDDTMLWEAVYPGRSPDLALADDQVISFGSERIRVLHTPGHSPGGVCLYAPGLGAVFSGDTLFNGGPGATGRSFSDYPTIVDSIESRLLSLPPETVVHTGHGDDTTIGAEAAHLAEWKAKV